MWYSPSMRVACHTCQCGCIGSRLYASDASDFHSSFGFIPEFLHIAAQMFAPKSERLSRMTNPPSVGMSKLSNFRPALWSLTRQSFMDPFFGTVNMGCETMLGSKHDPKVGEYRPNEISVSHWDLRKFWEALSSASNLCGHAMLPWGMLLGLVISANGQNPDLRPWQIEHTSSKFGWLHKSSSSWSALIGVMMGKRWGKEWMVLVMLVYQ